MMELYLLEQLIAFSRQGTLSGAAEKLHISQPALSQSMKKLEESLGVSLFERSKNKIALNENGIMAVQLGEKLLEQSREMEERLRLFDRSRRTLSVGGCAPVPLWDLLPLLSKLYPQMNVSTEMKNSDEELLAGLNKEMYQLIVTHSPPDIDLYGQPFRTERLFHSVPLEHPLANRKTLTPADLDGQNLLLYTDIGKAAECTFPYDERMGRVWRSGGNRSVSLFYYGRSYGAGRRSSKSSCNSHY